ncbi:o-succinylbenzoate synthase [Xanthocytophaga agilis]|uniref:O-succinylbenzoate synthase n=1 Tax=Xanthocytophaga agilis TaxID=3048010 RepID=A0AAE3R0Y6_9BACT|nr:o-succinylbenzoate synthase [Xanthocytophaga agilis]MDJ1501636.1 o-succinylbenzoate synthase [Xanthocytophaga agilis]
MLQASYQKHTLQFTFEAGTSRGILTERDTYYIKLWDSSNPSVFGLGECAPLRGLSIDDVPDYELQIKKICNIINKKLLSIDSTNTLPQLVDESYPSIVFGVETACLDLINNGKRFLFDTPFSRGEAGIEINGLIWMGKEEFMREQIETKLRAGYHCIKMKIGAINFEKECALLESIRKYYTPEQIILRVDANGAFTPKEALKKLTILSQYDLHSIEQPIKQRQTDILAQLCATTPLPIALDEELIGITTYQEKERLLQKIKPQYIILKPSLLGGFRHCQEWIELAEQQHIGWWITSALESNIGLNAIAQFTAYLNNLIPQGLGTGQLYHNNISSPLEIRNGFLYYNNQQSWHIEDILSFGDL